MSSNPPPVAATSRKPPNGQFGKEWVGRGEFRQGAGFVLEWGTFLLKKAARIRSSHLVGQNNNTRPFGLSSDTIKKILPVQPKKSISKRVHKSFLLGLLFLLSFSCVAPLDRKQGLTHGQVQMNVRVGHTTQTEILEAFGAPNITTIDGQGKEVWTYQRHATISQSSSGYATAILIGGTSSGFESSMRTMTLIIKFNKSKIVDDFKSMSSNF